jgi:peroxiredoxin
MGSINAESDAPFPILTDIDNGYAMSLNLAFWVGAEMQELMTGAGWDVSRSQGSDTRLLPIPATFVVGTDGEVKSRFIDPDYRKRVAIEELIAALKSAQRTTISIRPFPR